MVTIQPSKDISYQFRVSMAALMKQQSMLQNLLKNDKVRATEWFRSFGDPVEQIEDLTDNLIANPQRESQYVSVSMTCGDKKEAALIVNEMVDMFLSTRGIATTGEIKDKLNELRNQERSLQKDLDFSEAQLKEVRDTTGMTMLGFNQQWRHTITEKLRDLEIRKNALEMQISQLETTLVNFEQRMKGPLSVQDQLRIESDPVMISLVQRLTALEADLARKLKSLGEDHRSVQQSREVIRQTKEEKLKRQRELGELERIANYNSAREMLDVLQKELEILEKTRVQAEQDQKRLDAANAIYEQRLAIRDQVKENLNAVKEQISKYQILHNDPETPKVRSVGRAPEPLRVSSPRWEFYFPGGTVLGLMLGVALSFLLELLNDLVRTPTDVARYLHTPLVGMICHAQDDEQLEGVELCLVVRQAPYSITSECYRRLRTNLKLSGTGLKTLLVTSAAAGDGKTSTAVNLATALVAEDKKVLFIDANFRRPMSMGLFPRQRPEPAESGEQTGPERPSDGDWQVGLSNLLAGQCSYEEVIRTSSIEGLDIIDSGPLPANPAEMLGSTRMRDLLAEQQKKYDHIIVDGPPVLLVSEAKVLAGQTELVVLVVNADSTRRGMAQRCIRELQESEANLLGCVLFGARAIKGGYFHQLFKSYQEYQTGQLVHAIQ
jgi:Mrp family chromosome partitioning ATPase/uncharacterized protein involved in exopolysaccharide biosynthesis